MHFILRTLPLSLLLLKCNFMTFSKFKKVFYCHFLVSMFSIWKCLAITLRGENIPLYVLKGLGIIKELFAGKVHLVQFEVICAINIVEAPFVVQPNTEYRPIQIRTMYHTFK